MKRKYGEKELRNAAEMLYEAFKAKGKIPNISRICPDISHAEAYEIQRYYLDLRLASDSILGFKAGLCGKKSQEKLGCTEPLSGILYASGNFSGPDIPLFSSGKMMIETEIALIPGADITKPLNDVEELKAFVDKVAPVIEFPDRNFEDTEYFTAADMIASSVIASGTLCGSVRELSDIDINEVEVTLLRNGEKITEGRGGNTWEDDQWKCALWLVNRVVGRGYNVKKGSFLFTGAISAVTPASKGSFQANYGTFGKIDFNLN